MSSRKLSAGDTIEARCTRCRAVLNHTIVAMVGERVVRVECNTCRGMHNYHPLKEKALPGEGRTSVLSSVRKEPVPRKSKKDPEAADREEWLALHPQMRSERAIPYNMNGKYRINDLVEHPVFGLGVVKLLVVPNKIAVLFETGRKLLFASGK